jgi:MFS family permease
VYSFPNTVLPLIGGSMLDVFGTNGAMFTFLVLISLGQAIFALGVQRRVFWLSIVGRAVFGLGGESLSVAQSTLLAQWFEGKEMATAMGVNLSVSRLGSVANSLGNSHIARKVGVANALYIGFLMCCFSLVMTVLLILVDRYAAAQHRAAVASSGRIENLMDVASDEENLPPGV